MRHHMRSRVLLGTALLLTGIGVAAAQGMKEGAGGSQGGSMSGGSAGGGRGESGMSSGPSGSSGSSGASEMQRGGGTQGRGESMRGGSSGGEQGRAERPSMQDRTTGQGSRESTQSAPEPKAGKAQRAPDSGQAQRERGRKDQSTGKEPDRTTGQGSRDSAQPAPDQKAQPKQQQPQQQTQQPQRQQQGTTGSGTATQQQNQPSGSTTQSQSGVTLDSQKQASIQKSVISASNAPRVSNVNFAVSSGTVVPSSVRFVSISTFPILIETFPQYRDYSFFVVEDEIVILEPRSRRIVEVVPVGPRRASRGGGTAATSTEVLQLSEPEIREVQLVLVQRGLLVQADVTGVLNERTKTALISFQRTQGLQTSGSIDVRTVSALGLSSKVGPQRSGASGSSTTTGQGVEHWRATAVATFSPAGPERHATAVGPAEHDGAR